MAAMQKLQEEVAVVYSDVVATISSSGIPPRVASLPPLLTHADKSNDDINDAASHKDDPALKMRQVIEQPLLLQTALMEAAERAAAHLYEGASHEDLQAELERHEDDPEVQLATEAINSAHQECIRGRLPDNYPVAEAACKMWDKHAILDTFRALGRAKLQALEVATCSAVSTATRRSPGGALRACATAEDATWRSLWPSDYEARRRSFQTALERHTANDRRGFGQRREAIEKELAREARKQAFSRRS